MKYRRLGGTGIRLSMLGLGTLPFGTDTPEPEARRMVERCLEIGINHFDCANIYGNGKAEEVLGRCLAGVRDDVVLATKVGFPTGRGLNDRGASASHIDQSVKASLRRLGTDRIDLLYLHRFDNRTDLEHTLRALDRLVGNGTVMHLGASNFAAWQVATALGLGALHNWAPLVAMQPMYNLVKRQAEVEILPLAQAADLAVLAYGPLAGGLLTGKYGEQRGQIDGRLTNDPMYQARYRDDADYRAATQLARIAREHGIHPATLAVAWCAGHPGITAPLVGGRSLEQLEPSLAAADFVVDAELRARLSALTPEPPPATDRSEDRPD